MTILLLQVAKIVVITIMVCIELAFSPSHMASQEQIYMS